MSLTSTFALLAVCTLLLSDYSSSMTLSSSNCAVVGCGVLGTSLCQQMMTSSEFAGWKVTGVTKSTNRHESILEVVGKSERFELVTEDEVAGRKFDNVVFCAPPSGFEDYPAALEDCVTNIWSGSEGGGSFVFTSSGGIYGFGEGSQVVTESSPVADVSTNPRAARLINAEKAVLSNGGCCLRLAGLYNLERGAHNFWMTSGRDVSGRADGIVNQLHYDDAAGAAMAALAAGPGIVSGNIFLVSDGHPMTRVEICQSALKAKKFKGMDLPKFLGRESDPMGKIYDGSATNKALKWDPRYISFDSFMTSQG